MRSTKNRFLTLRGVQRAPTSAEASPPLATMLPSSPQNRPPQPTAVAQNETHSSYLDAGRRFCNQSQRYHRYAVKPAAQGTYTKKPIKTADPLPASARPLQEQIQKKCTAAKAKDRATASSTATARRPAPSAGPIPSSAASPSAAARDKEAGPPTTTVAGSRPRRMTRALLNLTGRASATTANLLARKFRKHHLSNPSRGRTWPPRAWLLPLRCSPGIPQQPKD